MAKIILRNDNIKEAEQFIAAKLKKYPDNPELLEIYSFILLKDSRIDDAQFFARKCLAKNSNSQTALKILAEICRLKKNYSCAINYWKFIQAIDSESALANLALIELYRKIKEPKMLDQEIRRLSCLQGALKLKEYIQKFKKHEKLLVYVPDIKTYSFIAGKCSN